MLLDGYVEYICVYDYAVLPMDSATFHAGFAQTIDELEE